MLQSYKPIIGITMGDPAGIGPEIIIKSILAGKVQSFCKPIVIGEPGVIKQTIKALNLNLETVEISSSELSLVKTSQEVIHIIPVKTDKPYNISWGTASEQGGRLSKLAIDKSVELALDGKIDAITTAPINKLAVNMAGLKFSGHTEYIAKLTSTDRYAMLLAGGGLRVIFVTTHHALKDVPRLIKKDIICEKIEIAQENALLFGLSNPRIAVCSLNPHASDGGVFGSEEKTEISPAVAITQKKGINVKGPIASDTLFVEHNLSNFDIVVAMYHDQGLIPLKMKTFGSGINMTLGLPIIRTSVDHGTAYNIAGEGKANTGSLYQALLAASDAHKYKNSVR